MGVKRNKPETKSSMSKNNVRLTLSVFQKTKQINKSIKTFSGNKMKLLNIKEAHMIKIKETES